MVLLLWFMPASPRLVKIKPGATATPNGITVILPSMKGTDGLPVFIYVRMAVKALMASNALRNALTAA